MKQVDKYNLSYVLTTRNKLPYLKEVMNRLIENVQDDEEIVVVDGASIDGSVEYLKNQFEKGHIHQLLSEPDLCQAHGTNKGLLMAQGQIIKILTDDDVFYFPGIRKCKEFLLSHPEIDVLNGNTADFYKDGSKNFYPRDYLQKRYLQWQRNERPAFWFGDQSLFIRRDKLPLIGLYHTGVSCLDVEQTVRLTALRQVKIAWYTGILACAVYNPNSSSLSEGWAEKNYRDVQRIFRFYISEEHKLNGNSLPLILWHRIRKLIRFKKRLRKLIKTTKKVFTRDLDTSDKIKTKPPKSVAFSDSSSISDVYKRCDIWMEAKNSSSDKSRFILPVS